MCFFMCMYKPMLPHGDYDHIGDSNYVINNITVKKVIFNCGKYNGLELNLIDILEKKDILYDSCIKELSITANKLLFLNNDKYDNENDNSSVIYIKFDSYKFLFTGDASVLVEKNIIEKYKICDIDVLKVGHHGSKTSSSKEFISCVKPNYSIISVGKNNRYGHPNDEVLNNLKDSIIYRTDIDGSVMFKIRSGKLSIKTYKP